MSDPTAQPPGPPSSPGGPSGPQPQWNPGGPAGPGWTESAGTAASSRTGPRLISVVVSLILLPAAWLLLAYAQDELLQQAVSLQFVLHPTWLLAFFGGLLALIGGVLTLRLSSLGLTIFGGLAAVLGLASVLLPDLVADALLDLPRSDAFGTPFVSILMGDLLIFGALLLTAAIATTWRSRASRRQLAPPHGAAGSSSPAWP